MKIAATNSKNQKQQQDTTDVPSPLLSRFDLVLILRDERNVEWDTAVVDHVLFGTEISTNQNLFDINKLRAHFSAV